MAIAEKTAVLILLVVPLRNVSQKLIYFLSVPSPLFPATRSTGNQARALQSLNRLKVRCVAIALGPGRCLLFNHRECFRRSEGQSTPRISISCTEASGGTDRTHWVERRRAHSRDVARGACATQSDGAPGRVFGQQYLCERFKFDHRARTAHFLALSPFAPLKVTYCGR